MAKPPALRDATGTERCGTCSHFDGKGQCRLYNYAVSSTQICNSYAARKTADLSVPFNEDEFQLQLAGARERLQLASFDESKHPRLHGRFMEILGHVGDATQAIQDDFEHPQSVEVGGQHGFVKGGGNGKVDVEFADGHTITVPIGSVRKSRE